MTTAVHKLSHKELGGGAPVERDIFSRWLRRHDLHINFDPQSEGGFIWDGNATPRAYVKSPVWRGQENDPTIRRTDMRPVFLDPKENVRLQETQSGGELEIYAWDPTVGKAAPIMGKDSPVSEKLQRINGNGREFQPEEILFESLSPDAKIIGFAPELAESCIELNSHHSPDARETALAFTRAVKKLMGVVEESGWLLTPVSIIPDKPIDVSDLSPDPYVPRMALNFMGWDNSRHFIGASWQVHVESLDLESSLKTANLYQSISPILYALSLSSPFLHGFIQPNLKDIYETGERKPERLEDQETYQALDSNDWMSIRYASRWRGSPSGGVFVEPIPEDREAFFAKAEEGLRINDIHSDRRIPSPARAAGHHRERIRIDIPPNGTLEIANMDTFGGHVLKLAAVQEFTRVLIWKLQIYAKSNRLDELSSRFPALFNYPVTIDQLRNAHMASIEVSKKGAAANILDAQGVQRNVFDLFDKLVEFVNEPINDEGNGIEFNGLPQGIIEELQKSALVPDEHVYSLYEDKNRIPSTKGFYEAGIGTIAHWLKKRASALKQCGWSDNMIIEDCMRDMGESYHAFLRKTNGKEIAHLFAS